GVGSIYGMYVITGLQETHQEFDRYGKAKKIEFTLTLQRVDEDTRERLQSSSVSELMATLREGSDIVINTTQTVLGDV
ncbi:phage tail protein, partial [Klebsiella variicola]|uniref:phage tail protein n=2 Tax=Klebsiella TaxID=570 RepID=UPI0039C239DE